MNRYSIVILLELIIIIPMMVYYRDKKKLNLVNPNLLFFAGSSFLFVFLNIINYEIESIISLLFNIILNLIVSISIYYILLLCALKYIRKFIYPQIITLLWTLPFIAYIFLRFNGDLMHQNYLTIHLDPKVIIILFIVWILGFISVLSYKVIEHIQYKNFVLKDAYLVKDEKILNVLESIKESQDLPSKSYPILISKHIESALSIGLFSPQIILPDIEYNDDELMLILKHEYLHIIRNDVESKIFLVFCNALCWFVPFVWIATIKNSEDIELACDHSVVDDLDETYRKKYATLILNTSACEKGFTSCLSANATSLKYRLENIINPKKKILGVFAFMISIGFLILSYGKVNITMNTYSGEEILFENKQIIINEIVQNEYEPIRMDHHRIDEFIHYLNNLKLNKFANQFSVSDSSIDAIRLIYDYADQKDGYQYIRLYENNIIGKFSGLDSDFYYVEDGLDWEYIQGFFYELPQLRVSMYHNGVKYSEELEAQLVLLTLQNELIYKEDHISNLASIMSTYTPNELRFDFSSEITSNIQLIIENEYGQLTSTILENNTYYIEKRPSKYTLIVSQMHDGQLYEATYQFKINI